MPGIGLDALRLGLSGWDAMPSGIALSHWPAGVEVPVLSVGHRNHPPTSFAGSGVTICREGLECMSKVSVFGEKHSGPVNAFTSGQGKEPPKEGAEEDKVYEWGCPVRGDSGIAFKQDRFEIGQENGLCKLDTDCICAARASPNSFSTLNKGEERLKGTFEVQVGNDGSTTPQDITVIPHYFFRTDLPSSLDIEDPHADIGIVVELPRKDFLGQYKRDAPRLQQFMDQLRNNISEAWVKRVETLDGKSLCDPTGVRAFSPADVEMFLGKMRRFQILSSDCMRIRENVAKLASMPSEEAFAEDGTSNTVALNCYQNKGSKACVQLNCYRGFDDDSFRAKLQKFKYKLEECKVRDNEVYKENQKEAAKLEVGPTLLMGAAFSPAFPDSRREGRAADYRSFL